MPLAVGLSNIANDPLFVSRANGDFHLLSNSPCINKGTNMDWMIGATDLDGNSRVQGGIVDMGAYEYPGAVTYYIAATVTGPGTISPAGNVFVVQGTNQTFSILSNAWCRVTNLTVDSGSVGPTNNYTFSTVSTNHTIDVAFAADLAALGTPHWWLAQYGWSNDFDAAESSMGSNGMPVWQSYIADLDPTNPLSLFWVMSISNLPPWTVYFGSSTARLYSLQCSTNLVLGNGWFGVTGQSNVLGNGGTMGLSATNGGGPMFYRVRVKVQ